MRIIDSVKAVFKNLRGPRFNKKYVIIESDDWGSIRMPSLNVYNKLSSELSTMKINSITKYDTIESDRDLQNLFEVLAKHKDNVGSHPKITANVITSNPDFDAIRKGNFETYYFQNFNKTLEKYKGRENVMNLHIEGAKLGFLEHQYHGREHVNVVAWMSELQNTSSIFRKAFDYETFAIEGAASGNKRNNLMATCDYQDANHLPDIESSLLEGYHIFDELFGKTPTSFIAPCYIWDSSIEEGLKKAGIATLQSISYQYNPAPQKKWYKLIYHYTGERNNYDQMYTVRNAFFEPYNAPQKDWVDECLFQMNIAFKVGKPAIIGSHRVNFMGSIDPSFADKNLQQFDELLYLMLKRWPDIEFVSSDSLLKIEK